MKTDAYGRVWSNHELDDMDANGRAGVQPKEAVRRCESWLAAQARRVRIATGEKMPDFAIDTQREHYVRLRLAAVRDRARANLEIAELRAEQDRSRGALRVARGRYQS